MTQRSVLLCREPRWQTHSINLKPSAKAKSWLYERGSLTQRLRREYGNVRVKVLWQHWQTPLLSERRLLKLPAHRRCLIREVLLYVDDTPLILARTVIPQHTFNGIMRRAHLGTRPLGEIIFSYHGLQRHALEISRVSPECWTAQAKVTKPLWARRTVYAIQQQQLLVNEFFLMNMT